MISDGLKILNKRLNQVDKRFKAEIVFYDNTAEVFINYRTFFSKKFFACFTKNRVKTINPKMLDVKDSDYQFIIDCIKDFQNDYL